MVTDSLSSLTIIVLKRKGKKNKRFVLHKSSYTGLKWHEGEKIKIDFLFG